MKTKCAKQPLVSVIVPVYKVEAYLQTCVDSILKQPYENIEIILVDDGSPDRCPMICEEYAKKDPRIRVIHQENRGPAWGAEHGPAGSKRGMDHLCRFG